MGEKTYRAIIAVTAFLAVGGFLAWFFTNHFRAEKEFKLNAMRAATGGCGCGDKSNAMPDFVRTADGYIVNPATKKYVPEQVLLDMGIPLN